MKKFLAFLFILTAQSFAVGPVLVNLVPINGLPGVSAANMSDSTDIYAVTANQTLASNYKYASLYNLRRYIASKTQDSARATYGHFDSLAATKARVNGRLIDSAQVLDTATGYATVITDTLRCGADVFGVNCYLVAGITGSSNAAGFTIGHIPLAFRPSHTTTAPIASVTDSGYVTMGYVSIASTGVVTIGKYDQFTRSPTATFTATGTKAVAAGTSFRYSRF